MAFEILLEPDVENMLRAEASRRGVSVQEFAKGLLEENLPNAINGTLPLDEEERLLDELAELGKNLSTAVETETYSRETIYAEHN